MSSHNLDDMDLLDELYNNEDLLASLGNTDDGDNAMNNIIDTTHHDLLTLSTGDETTHPSPNTLKYRQALFTHITQHNNSQLATLLNAAITPNDNTPKSQFILPNGYPAALKEEEDEEEQHNTGLVKELDHHDEEEETQQHDHTNNTTTFTDPPDCPDPTPQCSKQCKHEEYQLIAAVESCATRWSGDLLGEHDNVLQAIPAHTKSLFPSSDLAYSTYFQRLSQDVRGLVKKYKWKCGCATEFYYKLRDVCDDNGGCREDLYRLHALSLVYSEFGMFEYDVESNVLVELYDETNKTTPWALLKNEEKQRRRQQQLSQQQQKQAHAQPPTPTITTPDGYTTCRPQFSKQKNSNKRNEADSYGIGEHLSFVSAALNVNNIDAVYKILDTIQNIHGYIDEHLLCDIIDVGAYDVYLAVIGKYKFKWLRFDLSHHEQRNVVLQHTQHTPEEYTFILPRHHITKKTITTLLLEHFFTRGQSVENLAKISDIFQFYSQHLQHPAISQWCYYSNQVFGQHLATNVDMNHNINNNHAEQPPCNEQSREQPQQTIENNAVLYLNHYYPLVKPFHHVMNPASIAYQSSRNLASVVQFYLSQSKNVVYWGDLQQYYLYNEYLMSTRIAPTLSKYFWLVELLDNIPLYFFLPHNIHHIIGLSPRQQEQQQGKQQQQEYHDCYQSNDGLYPTLRNDLENISIETMYIILFHQPIISVFKWLYLMLAVNPTRLSTLFFPADQKLWDSAPTHFQRMQVRPPGVDALLFPSTRHAHTLQDAHPTTERNLPPVDHQVYELGQTPTTFFKDEFKQTNDCQLVAVLIHNALLYAMHLLPDIPFDFESQQVDQYLLDMVKTTTMTKEGKEEEEDGEKINTPSLLTQCFTNHVHIAHNPQLLSSDVLQKAYKMISSNITTKQKQQKQQQEQQQQYTLLPQELIFKIISHYTLNIFSDPKNPVLPSSSVMSLSTHLYPHRDEGSEIYEYYQHLANLLESVDSNNTGDDDDGDDDQDKIDATATTTTATQKDLNSITSSPPQHGAFHHVKTSLGQKLSINYNLLPLDDVEETERDKTRKEALDALVLPYLISTIDPVDVDAIATLLPALFFPQRFRFHYNNPHHRDNDDDEEEQQHQPQHTNPTLQPYIGTTTTTLPTPLLSGDLQWFIFDRVFNIINIEKFYIAFFSKTAWQPSFSFQSNTIELNILLSQHPPFLCPIPYSGPPRLLLWLLHHFVMPVVGCGDGGDGLAGENITTFNPITLKMPLLSNFIPQEDHGQLLKATTAGVIDPDILAIYQGYHDKQLLSDTPPVYNHIFNAFDKILSTTSIKKREEEEQQQHRQKDEQNKEQDGQTTTLDSSNNKHNQNVEYFALLSFCMKYNMILRFTKSVVRDTSTVQKQYSFKPTVFAFWLTLQTALSPAVDQDYEQQQQVLQHNAKYLINNHDHINLSSQCLSKLSPREYLLIDIEDKTDLSSITLLNNKNDNTNNSNQQNNTNHLNHIINQLCDDIIVDNAIVPLSYNACFPFYEVMSLFKSYYEKVFIYNQYLNIVMEENNKYNNKHCYKYNYLQQQLEIFEFQTIQQYYEYLAPYNKLLMDETRIATQSVSYKKHEEVSEEMFDQNVFNPLLAMKIYSFYPPGTIRPAPSTLKLIEEYNILLGHDQYITPQCYFGQQPRRGAVRGILKHHNNDNGHDNNNDKKKNGTNVYILPHQLQQFLLPSAANQPSIFSAFSGPFVLE